MDGLIRVEKGLAAASGLVRDHNGGWMFDFGRYLGNFIVLECEVLAPVRLKTAVAVRLVTVAVRLDTIAVGLETMVECVFGFKRSCSGE
ncbi:hypothetical protein Goshw_026751, partial [Gossypium schwendimanii]|nr:hypothetical protein [Gossypium schwendimanii]